MLRSDPGEFRHPAPKQRENSRTVFLRSMHTWCERNKSRQRDFRSSWWSPGGGAGLLQGLASTPARRGKVCSRLTAKASLVQREVANEMSRRDCRQKPCLSFISPSAGGAFCKGIVSTARRRGPTFLCRKVGKRNIRPRLWAPSGGALILQGAKPVRLAAGAFLLCVQKEPKYGQGGPGFPLDNPS